MTEFWIACDKHYCLFHSVKYGSFASTLDARAWHYWIIVNALMRVILEICTTYPKTVKLGSCYTSPLIYYTLISSIQKWQLFSFSPYFSFRKAHSSHKCRRLLTRERIYDTVNLRKSTITIPVKCATAFSVDLIFCFPSLPIYLPHRLELAVVWRLKREQALLWNWMDSCDFTITFSNQLSSLDLFSSCN